MKLLGTDKLLDFTNIHTDAGKWIESWKKEVIKSNWQEPQDIKSRYSSASFLSNSKVIFNVKGNSYRLAVLVSYKIQQVLVLWVGTHAEYEKINFDQL